MRRTPTKSRDRLRSSAAVALIALALAATGCGDLSRDELTRGVESLNALSAQGRLVANGVADDGTKMTYARVMSATLGGEAEHEAEKLADAEPSPEVQSERDEAVELAGEISDAFSQLQTFAGDEEHGRHVERELRRLQEKGEALAERLGGTP